MISTMIIDGILHICKTISYTNGRTVKRLFNPKESLVVPCDIQVITPGHPHSGEPR